MSNKTSTSATRTFDITIKGRYNSWEIPPRCRNPRDVLRDAETVVRVPIVTADEAPVVLRSLESNALDAEGSEFGALRGWDNRLWVRRRLNHVGDNTPVRVGGEGATDFPSEIDSRSMAGRGIGRSHAEFEAYYAESYAETLIVENPDNLDPVTGEAVLEVWEVTGEPRYVVQTFGLGANHGGTGMFSAWYDNPNIAAHAYFRADDFDSAKQYALRVAHDRGDTESIPRIEKMAPLFEVIDPDYITLVVPTPETDEVKGAREALRRAASTYEGITGWSGHKHTAREEAVAFRALVAARKALAALTDDTTGHDVERRPFEDR